VSNDVFTLVEPDQRSAGIIVNSPHSGRDYADTFIASSQLSLRDLRSSEDAYVDLLFDAAPKLGLPLLSAKFPRAFVDLNRASDELDPALIHGVPSRSLNPRVSSGLGVIPRVVAEGKEIRSGKMMLQTAEARLSRFYWPYHQQLTDMMSATRAQFGTALLLDCHSMPSMSGAADPIKYDIVLGDRFGASCSGLMMDHVEAAFAEAGFKTGRNAPFAGAYMAQRYGNPSRGLNVIQIEINRRLYLNEERIELSPNYSMVKQRLTQVLSDIVQYLGPEVGLAAE